MSEPKSRDLVIYEQLLDISSDENPRAALRHAARIQAILERRLKSCESLRRALIEEIERIGGRKT